MASSPALILQVPNGGALERALREHPPSSLSAGLALLQPGPTDHEGNLEALAGEAVISFPSPEALLREADEVRRVIRHAGHGDDPLVVLVEAADELREEELAVVADAAQHAPRTVILRVMRPG